MSRQRVYLLLLGYQHCVRGWLQERGWNRVPLNKQHWRHVTSARCLMGLPWAGTVWLQIGPETEHASRIHEELRWRGARAMDEVSAIDVMGALMTGDDYS